ncbi:hypothetical protein Hsw_0817 [Sporocytophaga myxococcoides]|uniref:Glycosyl transferase family 1 domain-containing protein n=1 Tax=Sporocytophaga myxococcoides TaxID=153721 RepID=A0A098LBL7_9BACT|nr:glycosyltransferase family 4 protein [Sporocytophaga myxococcoides]GAL83789.1 hypothetical protein Hsw_0817 [Sporocytophaga myxococcoides]
MGIPDKRTIIVVENCLGYTGAFKAILQVVENLSDQYRFVFVLTQGSSVGEILRQKGIFVYHLPFFPLQRKIKSIILYIPKLISNSLRLRAIVKKEKAVVIHANDIYNLSPLLVKLSLPGIKLVTHIRILQNSFPKVIYKTWVGLAELCSDVIIGVSKASLQPFSPSKRLTLIHDGISRDEAYNYSYEPEPLNYNLLYLANYIQGKGHELAIETFALVLKEKPNARLTFVGDTFGLPNNELYKKVLIDKARDLKIESSVIFKSFTNDIEKEFKESHVFLNLSEAESFSFTCLEALYYGVPCIATASGGPQEILDNGTYGILIYERNKHKVANEILKLLNNPDQRLLFSNRGRLYVRKVFSPQSTSYKVNAIYSRLIS